MIRRTTRALFAALLVSGLACAPDIPSDAGPDGPDGFDDHTKGRMTSVEQLHGWAREGAGSSALKFIVTRFSDEDARELRYMDGRFYSLHDEWFWFRLLNGQ